jgi:ABC-type Zn2+ transport system substrate-binding protein/surface adhesin
MKKLLLILSLVVIGLSGCYMRGYDDEYRRGSGHHEDHDQRRGHDEGKHDHDDEHKER